jgi:hypothetical protein
MLGGCISFAEAMANSELIVGDEAPDSNEKVMYKMPPGDVNEVVLMPLSKLAVAKVYTSLASGLVPTLMRDPVDPLLKNLKVNVTICPAFDVKGVYIYAMPPVV